MTKISQRSTLSKLYHYVHDQHIFKNTGLELKFNKLPLGGFHLPFLFKPNTHLHHTKTCPTQQIIYSTLSDYCSDDGSDYGRSWGGGHSLRLTRWGLLLGTGWSLTVAAVLLPCRAAPGPFVAFWEPQPFGLGILVGPGLRNASRGIWGGWGGRV